MRNQRDLENRIKVLEDKITLMTIYKDHFVDKMGLSWYFEEIDLSLDELKQLFIKVEKLKDESE